MGMSDTKTSQRKRKERINCKALDSFGKKKKKQGGENWAMKFGIIHNTPSN